MKKSIIATMFFACTAVLPAFSTTALTPPNKLIVSNKVLQEKTVLLHLANLEQKYTYVTITNLRGDQIYFSEGVKNHNGFHKAVDLKNLNSGRYLVKIKTESKIVKQVLSIDGKNVYLSTAKIMNRDSNVSS